MSIYICPYLCSYKTPSGFCGYTGGYEACQWRKINGFNYDTKQFYAEPVGSYEEAHGEVAKKATPHELGKLEKLREENGEVENND